MKLVPDWKNAWKWASTYVALIAGILPTAWMQLPAEFKASVPPEWMPYIGLSLFVSFLIARVWDQG